MVKRKKEIKGQLWLLVGILAFIIYQYGGKTLAAVSNLIAGASLKDFVNKYKAYAINTQNKYAVPYEVTLAQEALESGYGKHAPNFNFFGIKYTGRYGGKQSLDTLEYRAGAMVKVKQDFETFSGPEQAFNAHADTLRRVYPAAFNYTDPYKFAEKLTSGTLKYATDPNYNEKISKLITQIRSL